MTLLQIRDSVRRQIRDVPKVQWDDDGELDALVINPAYYLVQKEIFKVFPQAHLSWDTMDTVADENWYPLPATFGVKRVGYKATAADTKFAKLIKKDYDVIQEWQDTRDVDQEESENTYYAHEGDWLYIWPAPTVGVTDGLQLVHAPIQSLSQDTDIPRIKLPLHPAIVWWAKLIALGDTDEDSEVTRQRLQELVGDLANWYQLHTEEPDMLRVSR